MSKHIKKIKVKDTVPHLITALWQHPDCPVWLQDELWEAVNNRIGSTKLTPTYWKAQLQSARPDTPKEHEVRYGMLDADVIEGGVI